MKKHSLSKAGIIFAVCIAMASGSMLVACSAKVVSDTPSTSTSTSTTPPMQPASHVSRWDTGGEQLCYSCHGASSSGNPTNSAAIAIPDDHYIDGSSSTMKIDGERMQCIQCHVASQS